jgi:hypothetical protein
VNDTTPRNKKGKKKKINIYQDGLPDRPDGRFSLIIRFIRIALPSGCTAQFDADAHLLLPRSAINGKQMFIADNPGAIVRWRKARNLFHLSSHDLLNPLCVMTSSQRERGGRGPLRVEKWTQADICLPSYYYDFLFQRILSSSFSVRVG